ncbi:L,D-transpeptidase family protein [Actinoplanes sp. KI2]|uniref:L,D-transpeptidase n=1 Tax=Actinoplanes sp. KI2 TaxID=2983315 RepID=UPI0021D5C5B4|nr:L,D-transpeptidase family protein [Actinoplanes sp. KI2]MCU7723367.1 L,D-transpeptidase family protein [Actinoplanes sp. KI2]
MSLARTRRTAPVCVLILSFCVIAGLARATAAPPTKPPVPAVAPIAAQPATTIAPIKAPPRGLPVITYRHVPGGFPADPGPADTAPITEGLHAIGKLALYDAPGGNPRAFLPPDIRGVEVTVPIVEREPGWVAVLLPSINRRIGWLPATGWSSRPLRDQIVVHLDRHELTWLHDGVRQESWTVATGSDRTPTPPGRTFVLGRTTTEGSVYAGLDALVLGAVPDDRDAVAPGLRDAHTGIHGWYSASAFGRSISNGCLRLPRDGQRTLLDHIGPGTPVVVLD